MEAEEEAAKNAAQQAEQQQKSLARSPAAKVNEETRSVQRSIGALLTVTRNCSEGRKDIAGERSRSVKVSAQDSSSKDSAIPAT